MKKVYVNLPENGYPIYIGEGYDIIGRCLSVQGIEGPLAVITDSNVDKFQASELIHALKKNGHEVHKYVFEAGEKSKNLDTIQDIYNFLMNLKADRDITIIALGGGVVGDVAGFAAATYLRGVNFVQVPTSLLAQVDSSVGGKVGVNFEKIKNSIGAFYQPKMVYVNVDSLHTLPEREFKAGMGEVIVHCIIKDGQLYDYIDSNIDKIFSFDKEVLKTVIKTNCAIKSKVVEEDEKDKGIRAILNFGHTIGHAIESACDFSLLHGECVSVGVIGAFKIANYLGIIEKENLDKVEGTLKKIGLPVRIEGLDAETIYKKMHFDKKIKSNKQMFILPKKIGEVFIQAVEDEDLILKVINELIER